MPADWKPTETPRHKRIFIAIDGSVQSGWAAEYGGELAKELSGRVMLFHAIRPDTSVFDTTAKQLEHDEAARREGNLALERARLLLPPRVEYDSMQTEGVPGDEIVAAAKRWEADVIVMGTHGRGHVAQFLLGSTAEAVIRHAHCPVLTVGREPIIRQSKAAETVYELA